MGSTQEAIRRLSDGYTGNVFMRIIDAQTKSLQVTNEQIQTRWQENGVLDSNYQASIAQWKDDADKLPDAGKTGEKGASTSMNGLGIGTVMGASAGIAAIGTMLGAASILGALGLATSALGIGLIFLAIAAVIIGVALTLMYTVKTSDSPFMDTTPGYVVYDTGEQGKANNLVSQDQTTVTNIQNMMGQIQSQFVGPANDVKTQNANMIQGMIQALKSLVWTQAA